MCKAIYFDLDGTVADLYGVENWEMRLVSHDVTPYEEAEPMFDMTKLNTILEELKSKGVIVGVISWLAIGSNKEYDKATRRAKREWIKKHLPAAMDEIHLVKYGTPKHRVAKIKDSVLIDDNKTVRKAWKNGATLNPCRKDFLRLLKKIA